MEELTAAKASGSEPRLTDIIHTGLLTAEKFEAGPAVRVRDEMYASDLQSTLFASLPAGAQRLPDAFSATAWSAEVTARRKFLQRSLCGEAEATYLLASASDKDITSYFHRFNSFGEEQARASFLPNEKPAK